MDEAQREVQRRWEKHVHDVAAAERNGGDPHWIKEERRRAYKFIVAVLFSEGMTLGDASYQMFFDAEYAAKVNLAVSLLSSLDEAGETSRLLRTMSDLWKELPGV